MTRSPRVASEAIGTALLVAAVVGSGIMGERLAGGNVAITLLANAIATGATLVALILTFAPISGGHFNPAVTFSFALTRHFPRRHVVPYWTAQLTGALIAAAILVVSTTLGGLWGNAVANVIHCVAIVGGLGAVAWVGLDRAGGVAQLRLALDGAFGQGGEGSRALPESGSGVREVGGHVGVEP